MKHGGPSSKVRQHARWQHLVLHVCRSCLPSSSRRLLPRIDGIHTLSNTIKLMPFMSHRHLNSHVASATPKRMSSGSSLRILPTRMAHIRGDPTTRLEIRKLNSEIRMIRTAAPKMTYRTTMLTPAKTSRSTRSRIDSMDLKRRLPTSWQMFTTWPCIRS